VSDSVKDSSGAYCASAKVLDGFDHVLELAGFGRFVTNAFAPSGAAAIGVDSRREQVLPSDFPWTVLADCHVCDLHMAPQHSRVRICHQPHPRGLAEHYGPTYRLGANAFVTKPSEASKLETWSRSPIRTFGCAQYDAEESLTEALTEDC